jgi:hypothetical protein
MPNDTGWSKAIKNAHVPVSESDEAGKTAIARAGSQPEVPLYATRRRDRGDRRSRGDLDMEAIGNMAALAFGVALAVYMITRLNSGLTRSERKALTSTSHDKDA